jgi:hypothetical protein
MGKVANLVSLFPVEVPTLGVMFVQLSTYPLPLGGYYEDQGTSMSCPALVGCVALLLQARPGELGHSKQSLCPILYGTEVIAIQSCGITQR